MDKQPTARWINRLGFGLLFAHSLTACYRPGDLQSEQRTAGRRETIIMEFYANEGMATKKYYQEWAQNCDRRKEGMQSDEEALTTIAGELITRDPAHAHEYSAYIFESLGSPSNKIKAAALGALGEVPGNEATHALLEAAKHPPGNSGVLAAEAVTALAHKRAIAKLDPRLAAEVEQIEAGSVELCKVWHSNPVVEEYCESIGR